MSSPRPADELVAIVVEPDDPTGPMWDAVRSGRMDDLVPEMGLLQMEQDPVHRHKDVLAHTIAVTAKTEPRPYPRLAAMFHDIGKPRTRRFEHGEVTFHHHEAVGARMTRQRLAQLGFDDDVVADVSRLVELSGRFKGYADGWSDAAVRRYARDAGPLLGDLNHLVRCDCTTRDARKVAALHRHLDDLEARIARLAREDARRRERPDLDGERVMAHLGIEPGPAVGEALRFLLAEKRRDGALDEHEALRRLDGWWRAKTVDDPTTGLA